MKLLVPARQRLVPFLQSVLPEECSGKMVRRLLEANICRVNGRIERFGSAKLERGDIVEIAPSWKSIATPRLSFEFKTLYEDADLAIVDKPAGWVCSPENCRRTFGSRLQLIHRLDKDTTGVLALAKSIRARDEWMAHFEKREVEKEYLAIVDGEPKEEEGIRESFLEKKRVFEGQTIWGSGSIPCAVRFCEFWPQVFGSSSVAETRSQLRKLARASNALGPKRCAPKFTKDDGARYRGLYAKTEWKKLSRGKGASLLLCRPYTGRTHQIRVHLAEMGHPILFDRQYASEFRCTLFAGRPLLHAFRLRLGKVFAEAPLHPDMRQFILSCGMKEVL